MSGTGCRNGMRWFDMTGPYCLGVQMTQCGQRVRSGCGSKRFSPEEQDAGGCPFRCLDFYPVGTHKLRCISVHPDDDGRASGGYMFPLVPEQKRH